MKKRILLILIVFVVNGCSLVGLSVSDNIDNQLTQEDWESVNSSGIKGEVR